MGRPVPDAEGMGLRPLNPPAGGLAFFVNDVKPFHVSPFLRKPQNAG